MKSLVNNEEFAIECHRRWVKRCHRKVGATDYKEEWYDQQCYFCVYFIPLQGALSEDYGVCSCPKSHYDGVVRFEHDGCDYFIKANNES